MRSSGCDRDVPPKAEAAALALGKLECSKQSRHISLAVNCDFFEHALQSEDAALDLPATAIRTLSEVLSPMIVACVIPL